jgi:ubiquinone/menaquinone biosynthesis C-methylase UbiE
VSVTQGSLLDMPFDDAAFDGVMVNQVVHHLDDTLVLGDAPYRALSQVLGEIHRVLRPGGVLWCDTQPDDCLPFA